MGDFLRVFLVKSQEWPVGLCLLRWEYCEILSSSVSLLEVHSISIYCVMVFHLCVLCKMHSF